MFFHKYKLGKRSFGIENAPSLEDINWGAMALSTHLKLKMFVSDLFFILSLSLVINSDRLASFAESVLYSGPGDNAFSNFLNSNTFLRNAWNLLIAEGWGLVVSYVWIQGFWTESMKARAFLKRKYFLLFVTLYIVPIFNIDSLFHMLIDYASVGEIEVQWNCIFLADNGAYFINSMVLMALFGCAFTLFRWKSLIYQGYIFLTGSSWTEIKVRCTQAAYEDFDLDGNMSDYLVNFTISCCLASTSPLILPFGLFYSVIKHAMDSYTLIAGITKTTKLEAKPFYSTVTGFMLFSAVLSQVSML